MFDKFKQLKELKDLQDSIKKEKATSEKEGLKITVNGSMEIEEVSIPDDMDSSKASELVKVVTNDAMGEIRNIISKKMSGMGGFPGM